MSASTGSLTCNACRYTMPEVNSIQRSQHYSSQWHRYNVKRKCAQLPPISVTDFDLIASAAGPDGSETDKSTFTCCNKTFRSMTSFNNHIASKKHQKAESRPILEGNLDDNFVVVNPTSSGTAIPLGSCLFCDLQFDDGILPCLQHMTLDHGFFIPYREYLVDLDGLLLYFGCKIGIGHVCVHCNATFKSLQAVRAHMHAKSHCKMRWEPELDVDDDDIDGSYMIEKDAFEFDEFYDFDSDLCTDDPNDQSTLIVCKDQPEIESVNDAGELVISNGNIIGHRDYKLIYRQRVLTNRTYSNKECQIQAKKLIGAVEMKSVFDNKKSGQQIERLRQRQRLNYQVRAHRLAKFFKQQIPL